MHRRVEARQQLRESRFLRGSHGHDPVAAPKRQRVPLTHPEVAPQLDGDRDSALAGDSHDAFQCLRHFSLLTSARPSMTARERAAISASCL